MKSILDIEAARELELYAVNTSVIYHRHTVPVIENLTRKFKKGLYDQEKAVKAWEYVAEAAARLYCQEFAEKTEWHIVFSKATRRKAAESLESIYFEEYIKEA